MTDLTRGPQTDPTPIYRPRDGLYASALLTAALVHLDLFTGLEQAPADLAGVCRRRDIQERPAEVMMTLFRAMGLIRCEDGSSGGASPRAGARQRQDMAWVFAYGSLMGDAVLRRYRSRPARRSRAAAGLPARVQAALGNARVAVPHRGTRPRA